MPITKLQADEQRKRSLWQPWKRRVKIVTSLCPLEMSHDILKVRLSWAMTHSQHGYSPPRCNKRFPNNQVPNDFLQ